MQSVSRFHGVNMSTIERTLALIKPDGMRHVEAIVKRIRDAGFVVLQQRTVHLSPEQASEFYRNEKLSPDYTRLVMALAAGPVHALCIAKVGAIAAWKALMGPERYGEARLWPGSLRNLFANPDDDFENAVHGSENGEVATHEIHYFFPRIILEPIFNEDAKNKYLQGTVYPTLMDGLYQMSKGRPTNPVIWLANYLKTHNPYKPTVYTATEESIERIKLLQERVKYKSCDDESRPPTTSTGSVSICEACGCKNVQSMSSCDCQLSSASK